MKAATFGARHNPAEDQSMSDSPIAKRLSEASVVMEGMPHPELVAMLRIGAEEIQRLWDQSEKRWWSVQRLEGEIERLEKRLPTHCCRYCGALWIEYPPCETFKEGSFSLWSATCNQCCDNPPGDMFERALIKVRPCSTAKPATDQPTCSP